MQKLITASSLAQEDPVSNWLEKKIVAAMEVGLAT
jgi:hypothetical protein